MAGGSMGGPPGGPHGCNPVLDVPTVLEPISGSVLETSADAGYQAVAGLITCTEEDAGPGALIPPFTPDQPYYPATLHLFCHDRRP